ncbi:hypothetical protein WA158_008235 [Blastocystis sp. Blastoise]
MSDVSSQKSVKRSTSFLDESFKPGSVYVTGERKFEPLRDVDLSANDVTQFSIPSYISEDDVITKLTKEQVNYIHKENNIMVDGDNPPNPILNFKDLGLTQATLQLLQSMNIIRPTSIQMQGIPCICTGRDTLLLSETGSGKTIAYIIPLILRLMKQPIRQSGEGPSSIIISPTRELTEQIYTEVESFFQPANHTSSNNNSSQISNNMLINNSYPIISLNQPIVSPSGKLNHKVMCAYGGMDIGTQISYIQRGIDILICTPGRCVDLLNKNILSLENVEYIVIDECDKLVEVEIEQQLRGILSRCNQLRRQTVLCSATLPISVKRLLISSLINYFTIHIYTKDTTSHLPKNIKIKTIYIDETMNKYNSFIELLSTIPSPPLLVFVNSKQAVDDITGKLREKGFKAAGIHGDLPQIERYFILECFKQGGVDILITTDLLARGIDIKLDFPVVIYDMPYKIEDLIHRIGRTGRMGQYGQAYIFLTIKCTIAKEYKKLLKEMKQIIPDELENTGRFGHLIDEK